MQQRVEEWIIPLHDGVSWGRWVLDRYLLGGITVQVVERFEERLNRFPRTLESQVL
jgi:hypothetical protein